MAVNIRAEDTENMEAMEQQFAVKAVMHLRKFCLIEQS